MFAKNIFSGKIGKEDQIMADLLGNAFRSVQQQIRLKPLSEIIPSHQNKLRCRLNLYAMNAGLLDYLLISQIGSSAKKYAHNLRKQLIEIICHADTGVLENIEKLILDGNLISRLITNQINDSTYKVLSKSDLLNSYLSYKIKEYHYAAEINRKIHAKNQLTYTDFNKVTEIFICDFLGEGAGNEYDFAAKFSYNISQKSERIFSEEVKRIFA